MSDGQVIANDQLRWKPIPNFSSYDVSSCGKIRSYRSGQAMLLSGGKIAGKMGYVRFTLVSDAGQKCIRYLHQIVLEAHIGPRPKGMLALHRDGDVNNNKISNLYWGTYEENMADRSAHGRGGAGSKNPNARISHDDAQAIVAGYFIDRKKQVELSRMFGVSQAHISRVVRGTSWAGLAH